MVSVFLMLLADELVRERTGVDLDVNDKSVLVDLVAYFTRKGKKGSHLIERGKVVFLLRDERLWMCDS